MKTETLVGLAAALCGVLLTATSASGEPPRRADGRVESRVESQRALRRGATEADVAELTAVAADSARLPMERAGAIRSLGLTSRPEALAAIRQLAGDPHLEVRAAAASALFRAGKRAEALPLLHAAQDDGAELRATFRESFDRGRYAHAKEARAYFDRGLASRNLRARLDGAAGLLELGVREAEAFAALSDAAAKAPSWDDRLAALAYLAELPPTAAVLEALERAFADPEERVAKTARHLHDKLTRSAVSP
jgi:HEAT repeat protein